jgi:hypothetical protein
MDQMPPKPETLIVQHVTQQQSFVIDTMKETKNPNPDKQEISKLGANPIKENFKLEIHSLLMEHKEKSIDLTLKLNNLEISLSGLTNQLDASRSCILEQVLSMQNAAKQVQISLNSTDQNLQAIKTSLDKHQLDHERIEQY